MSVNNSTKRRTLLLGFWLCVVGVLTSGTSVAAVPSEAGAFFTQQFSPKAYGQSPQNWSVAQDSRGVMFFGNTSGVLEYDGAAWRTISIHGLPALSLGVDAKGTLFVGSQNDFGFLEPNGDGDLEFVSLATRLPVSERNFGNVWTVTCTRSAITFTTQSVIYRWFPDLRELRALPVESAYRSFAIDDVVYVYSRRNGLNRIYGSQLQPILTAEFFGKAFARGMARFHDSVLLATNDEMFRQEEGKFVRLRTDAAPLLRNAVINSILPLRNGDLAIATLRSGLILLNPDGSLKRVVDKSTGLRSEAIRSVFEDRQQGLWLALDRGIARVEAESPLTGFGEREGMGEMVTSLARYQGRIYAGTVVGLSYLGLPSPGGTPHFIPVQGIGARAISLVPMDQELIAGTASGIFSITNDKSRTVVEAGRVYDVTRSLRDPNVLYAVGDLGLYVLRRSGRDWRVIQHMKAPDQEFRSVLERPDGSLWIAARSAVYRVDWRQQPVNVESFSAAAGVPAGYVNAYRVHGEVIFATTKGLLQFDEAAHGFKPDFDFGKPAADGSHQVSIIRESRNGTVWISGSGYQAVLHKQSGSSYQWTETPLARAGISELYSLYLDDDDTAWASGMDGGVARYTASSFPPALIPALLLRRVEFLKSKRLVLNGESAAPSSLTFQFADNALRFEFALPDYEDPSRVEYQVWLQGLDHDWSTWSKETQKEYTNLYEKPYTLQIRARSLHGMVTDPAQLSFRVRPPWYRTWWSFILYFAGMLGAVALIIRLRLSHLATANRRLEGIIQARTKKVEHQRDQILAKEKETTALLLNILPPQVADELRTTGKVQPVTCGEVAICFTDFVGFTLSSETMSAEKLVAALDTYFRAFDKIIGNYDLEKLKTIGDAYMFVGGLPRARKSFAVDTVLAAMELVKAVEQFAHAEPHVGWRVRVGVNCGSAISGVVGSKKFAFDIWGDSVNLASRMESSGSPNCVNISADTYHRVKEFIECEPRGLVRTKEGRHLEMYFARRIQPELISQDSFRSLYEERFGKAPPLLDLTMQAEQAASHSL